MKIEISKLDAFEKYLIKEGLAKKKGFIEKHLNDCNCSNCNEKIDEFLKKLNDWSESKSEKKKVDPPIGLFLELRLFNRLTSLNREFLFSKSKQIADIEVISNDFSFQIECTHNLRKLMREFEERTTFKEGDPQEKIDASAGINDSFYSNWQIWSTLAKKAYKKINKPFVIYFWSPSGWSLNKDSFKEFLEIRHENMLTSEREQWSLINELLQKLENKIDLYKFEDADKDIEKNLLNKFYKLISKYQIICELEQYNIIRNSGGHIETYRKNPPSREEIKKIIVNRLVWRYMIEKSTNLIGIITDKTPLNERAKLGEMIPINEKKEVFEKVKKILNS